MFNIVDLGIIIFILFGAYVGFRRGVIEQGVMTIGLVMVIALSFLLKNPVSEFLYRNLPFYDFDIIIKNADVLNILLYETIAFIITFSILEILFIVIIKLSAVIQKIIKLTIVFNTPSRILGAILGAVEYYLLAFVILLVVSQPTFKISNNEYLKNSKVKEIVLTNTSILSGEAKGLIDTFNEVNELIEEGKKNNSKKFNCKVINVMLDKKVITKKSLQFLYDSDKISTKCKIGG